MKDKLIKFVKRHQFLYNCAKKINRKLKRIPPKNAYQSRAVFYTYLMKNKKELELIKNDYQIIKTDRSRLFIIITNEECKRYIHKLIRENLDILFADLNYFKKYQKKIIMDKIILLDYHQNQQKQLLNYIKL